jgi:hypothetical protein
MKYLRFIVLLVVIVISAGCVGEDKNTVVPPPQTTSVPIIIVTTTVPAIISTDPIIGTWKNGDGYTIAFSPNGKAYFFIDDNFTLSWKRSVDDQYILWGATQKPEDATLSAIYFPQTDTINVLTIDKEYRRVSFSPTSSPTYSSHLLSSSPTHFSGSGDDSKSFTATGTGLRIFTISHTGSGKFAIWLKDSSGKEAALLVNDIGTYSGKESERLASGTYYLNITADGAWTIDISSV